MVRRLAASIAALVALTLAAAALPSTAAAFPYTNTAPVTLGASGFLTCTASTVDATATNITSMSFSGCTTLNNLPCTVTALNQPWPFSVSGSGGATVTGVRIRMTCGSSWTCEFAGTLTGTYGPPLTLGGNLTRVVGGFPCPASGAFNGAWGALDVTNTGNVSWGTWASCTSSTLSGTATAITAATFSGCSGVLGTCTVTPNNLPWALTLGAGTATAGHRVAIACGGGASCVFAGTVSGTWNGSTLTLSGTVTRVVGGFPCPASLPFSGTWT
ncbi:MAG TPA: hypothetical protein VN238_16320 [Solirubrobacteraceae bacterium]|nr:hypothetical protein [Solirubrobacteraceae bacterium]